MSDRHSPEVPDPVSRSDARPVLGPDARPAAPIADPQGPGARQGEELRQATARFSVGDFRDTRFRLRRLLATDPGPGPEVRLPAEALLGRIGVDPVAVYLGIGCLILFFVVVYVTLG